jgi:hypothetical protein
VTFELPAPNYDETLVPEYQLPDALLLESGEPVRDAADFSARRRPELIELFRRHVYGRVDASLRLDVAAVGPVAPACGELALRRELDVVLSSERSETPLRLRMLVHTPRAATRPVPAFLGLNLFGNHTLHPDPAISLPGGWLPEHADLGLTGHVASDASRGMHAGRWPVEMLVARGYALATAYAGDIDPDYDDGFENGLHALLPEAGSPRPDDAPGTLAAWSFGLSRLLDALAEVPEIDGRRVAVVGHSRLGKAALWAAAQDERFALTISNQSGCGGAALSRRRFGETLAHINRRFPHWFCPGFKRFDGREHELPIDQHQLLALTAPRPLYVSSAQGDLWADPQGELLACQATSSVYALFGRGGLGEQVGYHARPGRHDITPRDFWHFLSFADRHLANSAC